MCVIWKKRIIFHFNSWLNFQRLCHLLRGYIMVDAHQNLNGSHNLITPLSGMICHPWTSTYYDQPVYQI